MESIKLPTNILLTANTKGGKSHYAINTLLPLLKGQYDVLVICSPNLLNGDYDKFIADDKTIFKVGKKITQAVDELIESQEKLFKMKKEGLLKQTQIPRILIILDDCLGQALLKGENSLMSSFAIRSRHLLMSFVIMTQKLRGMPRQVRLNCGYMVLFSVSNYSELEQVLDEYVCRKYRKAFREYVLELYKTPYNHLFISNFVSNPLERIWVNGTDQVDFSKFEA